MTANVFTWMVANTPTKVPVKRNSTQELFHQIIAGIEAGKSKPAVASEFGVSLSCVKKYARMHRDGVGFKHAAENPEAEAELVKLVAGGMSVKDAADQVMVPLTRAIGVIRWKNGGARELRRASVEQDDAALPQQTQR